MTGLWGGFWISFTIIYRFRITTTSGTEMAQTIAFQTSAGRTIHSLTTISTVNAGFAIKWWITQTDSMYLNINHTFIFKS
jgi:hypothetical protein